MTTNILTSLMLANTTSTRGRTHRVAQQHFRLWSQDHEFLDAGRYQFVSATIDDKDLDEFISQLHLDLQDQQAEPVMLFTEQGIWVVGGEELLRVETQEAAEIDPQELPKPASVETPPLPREPKPSTAKPGVLKHPQ
jgi:hypothetical protein